MDILPSGEFPHALGSMGEDRGGGFFSGGQREEELGAGLFLPGRSSRPGKPVWPAHRQVEENNLGDV